MCNRVVLIGISLKIKLYEFCRILPINTGIYEEPWEDSKGEHLVGEGKGQDATGANSNCTNFSNYLWKTLQHCYAILYVCVVYL